jgi:hypothetical protein
MQREPRQRLDRERERILQFGLAENLRRARRRERDRARDKARRAVGDLSSASDEAVVVGEHADR